MTGCCSLCNRVRNPERDMGVGIEPEVFSILFPTAVGVICDRCALKADGRPSENKEDLMQRALDAARRPVDAVQAFYLLGWAVGLNPHRGIFYRTDIP